MLDILSDDIHKRQKVLTRRSTAFAIRDFDSMALASNAVIPIADGAGNFKSIASIMIRIGRGTVKSDCTRKHLFIGSFILDSFITAGLVEFYKQSNDRDYRLKIVNCEAMDDLVNLCFREEDSNKTLVYRPVKKRNQNVSEEMEGVLEKLHGIRWKVNREIFEVLKHFHKSDEKIKTPLKYKNLPEITKRQKQIKKSHESMVDFTYKQAEANLHKIFYKQYQFDFRGRIYPFVNTLFWLNEQGNDIQKSLMMFAESKPLKDGYEHFLTYGKSVFGKEPEHYVIMNVAADPYNDLRWAEAEKPWMFLAFCFEYAKFHYNPQHQTSLPIFIDGSCNGLQHLSALSRDETIGRLVNLTPNNEPQDVYGYIADKLWSEIEEKYNALSQDEIDQFEGWWKQHQEYSQRLQTTDRKSEEYEIIQKWFQDTKGIRRKLYPVFWMRITDPGQRRKVVKRCVMTTPYLSTINGKSNMIYDDTRGLSEDFDNIDKTWCFSLGKLIHRVCYDALKGPSKLLKEFKALADRKNMAGQHLSWQLPTTKFTVMQRYTKQLSKRAVVYLGDSRLKLSYKVSTNKINTKKQTNGSAANIVHSLDGAHMAMVVNSSNFPIATVHDSWGCLPADMGKLHKIVRNEFVCLYEQKPLDYIFDSMSIGSIRMTIDMGKLDLNQVRQSKYAFI